MEDAFDSDNNAVTKGGRSLSLRAFPSPAGGGGSSASSKPQACGGGRVITTGELSHDKYIYLMGACVPYKKLN